MRKATLENTKGKVLLWILAFLLMAGAAVYQRATGPTHPMRGTFQVSNVDVKYRIPRSGSSSEDQVVTLPASSSVTSAILYVKRFKTDDPFAAQTMTRHGEAFVGRLPRQPAAGKLEYYITLETRDGVIRIPENPEENPIIRFKDDVPAWILVPHIIMMFLSMMVGIRAGLSALAGHADRRVLSWVALGGLTIGGLVLGPIVQKYAFGAYWTGFPFGYDLTDNKMLILWLFWAIACGWQLAFGVRREAAGRAVAVLASVAMIAVYLIPHSMRGSELDYSKLDRGVPASEAVRTGE